MPDPTAESLAWRLAQEYLAARWITTTRLGLHYWCRRFCAYNVRGALATVPPRTLRIAFCDWLAETHPEIPNRGLLAHPVVCALQQICYLPITDKPRPSNYERIRQSRWNDRVRVAAIASALPPSTLERSDDP